MRVGSGSIQITPIINSFSLAITLTLVIPDGCIGLPTLAALEQGIPVIAVKDNVNVMSNDLTELPWSHNQLHIVNNYLEAVGVMTALKSGVPTESVKRPLASAKVTTRKFSDSRAQLTDLDGENGSETVGV